MREPLPRAVAERGGSDDEGTLATLAHVLLQERPAQERLAEPDAVGNEHAVVVVDDALRAPDAVALKAREMDAVDVAVVRGLLHELLAVLLPQHP